MQQQIGAVQHDDTAFLQTAGHSGRKKRVQHCLLGGYSWGVAAGLQGS